MFPVQGSVIETMSVDDHENCSFDKQVTQCCVLGKELIRVSLISQQITWDVSKSYTAILQTGNLYSIYSLDRVTCSPLLSGKIYLGPNSFNNELTVLFKAMYP